MTSSLSIHGALSEDARETLSGKGREGNKEGKGACGETPIHVVTYVTREAASTSGAERATAWMGQNS